MSAGKAINHTTPPPRYLVYRFNPILKEFVEALKEIIGTFDLYELNVEFRKRVETLWNRRYFGQICPEIPDIEPPNPESPYIVDQLSYDYNSVFTIRMMIRYIKRHHFTISCKSNIILPPHPPIKRLRNYFIRHLAERNENYPGKDNEPDDLSVFVDQDTLDRYTDKHFVDRWKRQFNSLSDEMIEAIGPDLMKKIEDNYNLYIDTDIFPLFNPKFFIYKIFPRAMKGYMKFNKRREYSISEYKFIDRLCERPTRIFLRKLIKDGEIDELSVQNPHMNYTELMKLWRTNN